MKLYEIKAQLEDAFNELVDEETGEITNPEIIEKLEMAFAEKIDALISFIKSTEAEAKAIKDEEDALKARRMRAEKKAESLRGYLEKMLAGAEFSNERHQVKYRGSKSVEINMDAFYKNEDADLYLTYKEPVPNKMAIKKALEAGVELKGAELVTKNNMQIK